MQFNHDREIIEFQNNIDLLKSKGYNVIAVTQMCFEDVYVFETNEEATKAYNKFERDEDGDWIGEIVGWWYGKDEFIQSVKEYETDFSESNVLIHWLNK